MDVGTSPTVIQNTQEMLEMFDQLAHMASGNTTTGVTEATGATGGATATTGATTKKKTATATQNMASSLYYVQDDTRHRTFHDLVRLSATYDTLNREERTSIIGTICISLRQAERAVCDGSVTRRPVRDSVRALCYGARLNTDLVREHTLSRLEYLGLHGLSTLHMTDKFLVKNIDLWYPYAPMESCEWLHANVLSEDIVNMLQNNTPLKGRACRGCVTALLRLSRNGINTELGKFNLDAYLASIAAATTTPVVPATTSAKTAKSTAASASRKRKAPPAKLQKRTVKVPKKQEQPVAHMPDLSAAQPFLQQQVSAATAATTDHRRHTIAAPKKAINKDSSPTSPMSYEEDSDDDGSFLDIDDERKN